MRYSARDVAKWPVRTGRPVETLIDALAGALGEDPGRPLVTFYDIATGERVELSVATFDNWVAKVANLLTDQLDRQPGDRIAVYLPPHWQSTVLTVGAWRAGLALDLAGSTADVSVVGPTPRGPDHSSGDVIVCSLRPLGGPMLEPLPEGWIDFAVDVPAQPDVIIEPRSPSPDDPAAMLITGPLSHRDLLAQAVEAAGELGLPAGGRLITDADPARASGIVAALAAPLAVGGSVVIVANAHGQHDERTRIAEQEHAATSLWLAG
jgi:uncharacterized protein (TIGR03089 family)